MKAYKKINKGKLTLLALSMMTTGAIASVGIQTFAQTTTPVSQDMTSVKLEQTTGPDTDNIQDQTSDGKSDTNVEVGGVETSGTGTEAKEAPGGHEDVGANADHQFEGVE